MSRIRKPILFFTTFLFIACAPKSPKVEKKETKFLTIKIKGIEMKVEMAKNEEERVLGLKYRDSLPKNSGMLFIFEEEGIYPFWMVDTKIPLDIAFIDKNRVIVDIQSMEPFSPILHKPNLPFLYALEVNQGFFQEKGIKKGDTVFFGDEK
ncbi:MAG: DUF192 domain-containing protein [candidate division WOR-3 bacterium]